jgi:hypothetical protein
MFVPPAANKKVPCFSLEGNMISTVMEHVYSSFGMMFLAAYPVLYVALGQLAFLFKRTPHEGASHMLSFSSVWDEDYDTCYVPDRPMT